MTNHYLTGLLAAGVAVATFELLRARNNPTPMRDLTSDIATVLIEDSIVHDLPKLKEVLDNLVDFFESLGGRAKGIKYYANHAAEHATVSKTIHRLTTAANELYGQLDNEPEFVKVATVDAFFEEVIAFFETYTKGAN